MAGGSISPPGVDVIQEFVTVSTTASAPAMPSVLVAPAFQLVDAFDDNGDAQASALAGSYRDGQGVIAYSLPGLVAQASLVGFESDLRVFLVYGTETRELFALVDEEVIVDNGTGTFTLSTLKWVDATQLYTQVGVEAGDVVRLTWRGEPIDVAIASVDDDVTLTLAASALSEDLAGFGYDIVRNPAEYVFNATQQANTEFGDDADHIRFTAATLKEDGITAGDYIGAAGDALTVLLADSEHLLEGTIGAVGDSIFEDTGAGFNFLSSVGARGLTTGTAVYAQVGTLGAAQVLREVVAVVSDAILIIETGEGVLAASDWYVGTEAATGADGVTNTDTSFSSATALFLTTIPQVGGAGTAPVTDTYIEIEGDGVYQVATVDTDTALTLAAATAGTAAAQTYTVITETASGTADGETKADTVFVQADAATDLTGLANDATESLNIGGTEAATLTVTDANELALGASLTDGGLLAWSATVTASSLALSWDPTLKRITIQIARVAGITSNTYAEVNTAITTVGGAYNVVVSDIIDSALGGTVGTGAETITEADLDTTLQFDGGSAAEQLLLDADLLASATPTAQVYTTFKALRVDLSDQATEPALWDINDQTQRLALLGAANADNPLSLMVYFALLNSPGTSVKALGVSAVSATKPSGTVAAYASAFEYLEGYDVHLIVPGTLDLNVAQILETHVDAMSLPTEKSERIGFFNSPMPVYKNATVLASGASGNTGTVVAAPTAEFSSSVDFLAQGVVAGDILVVSAVSTVTDSPEAVNGTLGPLYGVLVTGIKAGDSFVLEFDGTVTGISTNWNNQVDVSYTVYRAGIAISQAVDQAEVIAEVGEGYGNRRMFHHWPDKTTADVEGTISIIDGYHAAASWAGKANKAPAQQGFSRGTIAGHSSTKNSNGYFSRSQLDRIAGGGTWVTHQESQGAPLRCRHQISTDVSSVEKREFSITRVVDYTAKYLRSGLNLQVGNFNITQSYLDGLATSVQGLLRALVDSGTLTAGNLVSLAVNDVSPDKVDVVVAIDVPYPANYIEVTIQV